MAFEFGNQSKSYLSKLVRKSENAFKALSYQKLTVDNTSGGVSLTVPTDAKYAELRFESTVTTAVAARYLNLGSKTPPTTTDGMALNNGDFFDITDYQNLVGFRAIQTGAGTHTLHIQYYK